MTSVAIRIATLGDIPTVLAFDHVAAQDESRREFIRHAVTDKTCVVGTVGDEVIGYAVLEYTFFECGFVSLLYVHPDHRRRKVGQGLLEYVEKTCRTSKLFTSTNLSNLPMQSLLATRGYVLSGIIHNLDEGDPEIIYFKHAHV
jgi:N-acetylglutamate synthase-like GNAT family acetyltransferase